MILSFVSTSPGQIEEDPDGGIKMFHRPVVIEAKLHPPMRGQTVYFGLVDEDDPSTDDPIVDPNGPLGNDNRGPAWLTAKTALTDQRGVARVTLINSRFLGDDVKVLATTDPKEAREFQTLLKGNVIETPEIEAEWDALERRIAALWTQIEEVWKKGGMNRVDSFSLLKPDRRLTRAEESLLSWCLKLLRQGEKARRSRYAVVQDLGRLRHEWVIPVLASIAKNRREEEMIRVKALMALAQVPSKKVFPILIDLVDDSDAMVRFNAADRLWMFFGRLVEFKGFGERNPRGDVERARYRFLAQQWRSWWKTNQHTVNIPWIMGSVQR